MVTRCALLFQLQSLSIKIIGFEQIAKVAMMAATTARPLLSLLSADSLISIQEVPKGADRNPQRTIYLW